MYNLPKDEVVQMYLDGQSTNKIAKIYGCNSGTIYLLLKKAGVEIKRKQKFIGVTSDYDEQIISLYNDGNGSKKISKILGICSPAILDRLRANGIDPSINSKVDPNNLLKDKTDQVIELYNSGKSSTEIARTLGHSQSQIWTLLKKNGIDYKWKIGINSDYFEVIDTPEKAYILGWWYSDGCIDKKSARIKIATEDDYALEWIKEQTGYQGNIKRSPSRDSTRKPMSDLSIHDKKFREDLEKQGCTKNKSLTLKFPTPEIVPDHLIWHFLRGEFDGDGSISAAQNHCSCSITSSVDFCNSLSKFLNDRGIKNQIYPRKRSAMVMMTMTKHALQFCENIYKDASFFLTRKYSKYEKIRNRLTSFDIRNG